MNDTDTILQAIQDLRQEQKQLREIMVRKTELKLFIDTLSPVIDARAKTTELFVKAEMRGVKEELHAEIKEAKEELHAELKETREELHAELKEAREELHAEIKEAREELQIEILASRAAAHEDMTKLASGHWKKDREQDSRLDALDEHTGHHNPIKQ